MVQVSYEYDAYNQLVKETYQNGDVIEYSYDNGGNLLSKTVNSVVSNSYTYGDTEWKDLLTGFNGTTITYDEIGNPQNWRDGMSFTWVNGRQLGALQKGDLNVSYSYNSDGLRVSKTVNGVKTEYVWDGSSLIGQKTGNNVLVYLYAADGLAGFQYNGVNYYYLKNGQGDVIGILNSSGTLVAKYTYDAWGNLLSVIDATGADKSADSAFIGNINPVRYRSYYYDTETGLYYLQSRYYDPEVGRFVNADVYVSTGQGILSANMFAYCLNNPITYGDYSGTKVYSVGLNGNATLFIFGISLSVALVFDDYGNWGFQFSHAGIGSGLENPAVGIMDIGGGVTASVYWGADTIYDLEGDGLQFGATAGSGIYGGFDVNWLQDGDYEPDGLSLTLGYGAGVDIHVNVPYTEDTKTVASGADNASNFHISSSGRIFGGGSRSF